MSPQRDPDDLGGLEERLRRTFHEERPDVDVESFLGNVHRGARRHRRRQVIGGAVATVAVIGLGAYGVTAAGLFDDNGTPAADQTTAPVRTTSSAPGTATSTETPPPGQRALSLSATDSERQYVLVAGRFGCRGDCLAAYITDDAGRSWSATSPLGLRPADPDPTDTTAYAIRFADSSNGWVFGGGLRATHDGGRTWTTPKLPARGIVTTLEAWGDRVYAGVEDYTTETTTLVGSPVDQDAWVTIDVGQKLNNVTEMAVSKDLVAVLASPTPLSEGNEILISTDGQQWTTSPDPCSSAQWPNSVSTSADSLWTVCSSSVGSAVYVSTDAGDSWTVVPGEFFPGSLVQARDDSTAVVVDSNEPGVSIVTVKNQPQHILDDRGDLLPIGFTNPTTGYLRTGDGGILRTLDSGATWQDYPLP